ncbi:uncharacterized protein [Amphiura filiformis]|uniref:uncharacterized protein isoform X2 n=1 Tax=Amphiura filiformis TaxID=82378 RepID=UPI003B215EAC
MTEYGYSEIIWTKTVNKRCKRIFSSPHAWTYIDFWQEQKTNKKWRMFGRNDKNWMFPADEKAVLHFLKRYTSGSLKSIYLHITSEKILAHLQQTYGNLETISFLSADDPPREARALDMKHSYKPLPHDHDDNLPVDKSIKVCEIPLCSVGCSRCGDVGDKLLIRLGKCKNLRRLTITGINSWDLKPEGWDALPQDITELNFLGVLGHSSQLCIPFVALLKLTKVSSFRLSIADPTYSNIDIDEFLCGIADKWQDLRRLTLVGIRPPSGEIFAVMISALSQLQILELYGEMITDENIALIATHLKKLTSLTFTDGNYTPSGIRGLCGHPSIERLYLEEKNQHGQTLEWLLAVYEVILSLPQIAYVKIIGYRVIVLHAQHEIPTLPNNIQIEVENAWERVRPRYN